MLNILIEWYIDRSLQIIAGQLVFFALVSFWAWKERGRTHFLTEVGMYAAGMLAFSTGEDWAFSLLSLSLWAHILLIVREITLMVNNDEHTRDGTTGTEDHRRTD